MKPENWPTTQEIESYRRQDILQSILAQFENGEEKFNLDPLVQSCVLQILEGQSPIKLIDQLINNINDLQKQVTAMILKSVPAPIHITMTKDEVQSFKEMWLKEQKKSVLQIDDNLVKDLQKQLLDKLDKSIVDKLASLGHVFKTQQELYDFAKTRLTVVIKSGSPFQKWCYLDGTIPVFSWDESLPIHSL